MYPSDPCSPSASLRGTMRSSSLVWCVCVCVCECGCVCAWARECACVLCELCSECPAAPLSTGLIPSPTLPTLLLPGTTLLPSSPLAGPPPSPPRPPSPPPPIPPEELAWFAATATAAAALLWAAAATAAAAFALTDGGRMGLQGEWELPEALDEAAKLTPEEEYKSWLNWKCTKLLIYLLDYISRSNQEGILLMW